MPTEVHRNEVRRLVDTGAQLVEVLPPQEYEAEHLPGAVNIPLKQMNAENADQTEVKDPLF